MIQEGLKHLLYSAADDIDIYLGALLEQFSRLDLSLLYYVSGVKTHVHDLLMWFNVRSAVAARRAHQLSRLYLHVQNQFYPITVEGMHAHCRIACRDPHVAHDFCGDACICANILSCRAATRLFFHNLAPSCTFLSIVNPLQCTVVAKYIYLLYISYMRYMQFNIFSLAVYITMMVA